MKARLLFPYKTSAAVADMLAEGRWTLTLGTSSPTPEGVCQEPAALTYLHDWASIQRNTSALS